MASRPQHSTESERCGSFEVASWDVASGDTVVVRGVFTRAEVRAHVDLVERLYPDAGLTVIFLPPGVGLERAARMAEAWRDRAG